MADGKKNSRRTPKEATKGGGGKRGIHPVEAAEPPASGMLTIVAPAEGRRGDEAAEQKQIRVDYLTEGEDHPAVEMPRGEDAAGAGGGDGGRGGRRQ